MVGGNEGTLFISGNMTVYSPNTVEKKEPLWACLALVNAETRTLAGSDYVLWHSSVVCQNGHLYMFTSAQVLGKDPTLVCLDINEASNSVLTAKRTFGNSDWPCRPSASTQAKEQVVESVVRIDGLCESRPLL